MGNKVNKKKKNRKSVVYRQKAQHLNELARSRRALSHSESFQIPTETDVSDVRSHLTELTNVIFDVEQATSDLVMQSTSNAQVNCDENCTALELARDPHQRMYCKPKTTSRQYKRKSKPDQTEQCMEDEGADERRIVDIKYFFENLKRIANHCPAFGCTLANLTICSEKKIGLLSKLKLNCDMCKSSFYLNTCNPQPRKNLDINTSAVSGITTSGIGFSQFQELFASMNISTMSQKLFTKKNNMVCDEWCKTAAHTMAAAAERERLAAIEEGRVKGGIAVIDVVVDGCWAKRSYKSNYSALSGAAAIIGRKFGEVLYIGMRNKYCSICARAENKGNEPNEHICYKNYSGPSTGMESDILVEGFKHSVDMYNIIYGRMIANGDSSTYLKILEARPYANVTVEKIECRNHLFRNMCNKLSAVTKELKHPLLMRKTLSTQRILAIRKAICLAIKQHSNRTEALQTRINDLYVDISNSYNHAFGDHKSCKDYYCQSKKASENLAEKFKTSTFWNKIQLIVGSVASNSRSLIHNVDSNRVEQLNSIIAKFIGGKRINFTQRHAYQSRCSAAVVSYNTHRPLYTLQKSLLGFSPKSKSKILEQQRIRKNMLNKKYVRVKKNLFSRAKDSTRIHYGDNCQRPDLSPYELDILKTTFLTNLRKTEEEKTQIQEATILQRDCSEWLELRRQLLTASNFGKVINRRSTTSSSIVKTLLYKSNISHVASIKHGIDNEKIALNQLSLQEHVTIQPCGLFIDSEIPYLGATPDGLVGEDAIVEVKCPISAYRTSAEEAVKEKKIRFWTIIDEAMVVNKKHPWFLQVQGQLHITKRDICLFAVCSGENKPIKVETIHRDDTFWAKQMVDKLKVFYIDHILPELVDPRQTRNAAKRTNTKEHSKT